MSLEPSFFISSWKAYESLPHPLLVITKQGPEFVEKESFLLRLFKSLLGYINYNLTESSSKLAKTGAQLLNRLTPPLSSEQVNELHAAIKVMKVSIDLALKKRNSCSQTSTRSQIVRAVNLLSIHYSRHPIQLALELNLIEIAYSESINRPIPEDIPPHLLGKLLPLAVHKNRVFALKLIKLGASLDNVSIEDKTALAWYTIDMEHPDDRALSLLVKGGCKVKGEREDQMLPKAALQDMTLSVAALLDKDVNLHATLSDENSALHLAYLRGNVPLIRLLSKQISPLIKNRFGHTPLMAVLNGLYQEDEFCKIPKEASEPFLNELFFSRHSIIINEERSPKIEKELIRVLDSTALVQKESFGNFSSFPFIDVVEIAYLLDDNKLQDEVFSSSYRENVVASCDEMRKKYPERDVDTLLLKSFKINRAHLSTGCIEFTPSEHVAGNPDIEQLLDIFDSINWTNPNAENFFNPHDLLPSWTTIKGYEEARADARERLNTFLNRVSGRVAFEGTPLAHSRALEVFYHTIELEIQHIIHSIQHTFDPDITRGVLKEFIQASTACGGRYFATALKQYLLVCQGVEETPIYLFQKTIAECRKEILEGVVTQLYADKAHNVHAFTRAVRDLGQQFGIPGYQQMKQFKDRYTISGYRAPDISSRFVQLYSPHAIITEWYLPALKSDAEAREAYIDLHKEYLPSLWKKDHYANLQKRLLKISPDSIDSFLDDNDIFPTPGQKPAEAIEADRVSDYLEHFVFNEQGELRLEAIIYLFEKLGVITSKAKWQDRKREVIPIQTDRVPLLRRVNTLFRTVNSWVQQVFG